MGELWRSGAQDDPQNAKVRVAARAATQKGRVTWAQLRALGVAASTCKRWLRTGYLFGELPGVYAVGHPGASPEGDLFTAVLYAGPGAALDGMTAALWRGLVKWRTAEAIEVSTPRRRRSLAAGDPANRLGKAIRVRDRRESRRWMYHGIPTVPIPLIVLDLASTGDVDLVRFVLAQMDFMRILNERALRRVCGRGIPGSSVLREALGRTQPLFARCRSPREIQLIQVCELTSIPLPAINEKIGDVTPDAIWWDEMVVVEIDGQGNHGTWRQKRRDSKNDVVLRKHGFLPIHYTADLLGDPWAIHADLMPQLEERRGRAAARLGERRQDQPLEL
jgi:hypothetical protein